jgi:hypothetical protein
MYRSRVRARTRAHRTTPERLSDQSGSWTEPDVRGSVSRQHSIMQYRGARTLAFFTALLCLLAVSVPARAQYFCRMMDRVVDSCCCESSAGLEGERRAELRAPDCCVRLTRGALPAAEVRRDAVPPLPAPALVTAAPLLIAAAPVRQLPNLRRPGQRVRPTRGPPLFLQHCALLI